jgi:hypothetical protein
VRQQQPRCREREKYARVGPYYLTPPCAAPFPRPPTGELTGSGWEAAALRRLATGAASAPIHPPGSCFPAPVGPPVTAWPELGGGAYRPPAGWPTVQAPGRHLTEEGGHGNANLRSGAYARVRGGSEAVRRGVSRRCAAASARRMASHLRSSVTKRSGGTSPELASTSSAACSSGSSSMRRLVARAARSPRSPTRDVTHRTLVAVDRIGPRAELVCRVRR